jgi:alpha-tubulin suppressor-like RCC1 family protein
MRAFTRVIAPVLAAGLTATLGCRDDVQSPSVPEPTAALSSATAGALSFRQVSAGAIYSCGLSSDSLAYCWGSNTGGQLGDGTRIQRLRPVAVAQGRRFVQISAGGGHTCAVTKENRAYCWGDNSRGQLGDGTNTDRLTPTVIPGYQFRQIRAGDLHTCGVNPNDVAFCWGNNDEGQLGGATSFTSIPTRVAGGHLWKQVIAGASHSCGVTTDNRGYCWGNNDFGQLGDGTRYVHPNKPVLVAGGLSFRQIVPGGGYFFESSDGSIVDDGHTCALTTDNKAYCWGLNLSGVLGSGTVSSGTASTRLTPVKVAGGRSYRFLNTGYLHTCAVTLSNAAFCWGDNSEGQLGVGSGASNSSSPVRVAGGLEFSAVSAGTLGYHNCAWTTTDHRAYCWGRNNNGQLGDGTTTTRFKPVAVIGP